MREIDMKVCGSCKHYLNGYCVLFRVWVGKNNRLAHFCKHYTPEKP